MSRIGEMEVIKQIKLQELSIKLHNLPEKSNFFIAQAYAQKGFYMIAAFDLSDTLHQ